MLYTPFPTDADAVEFGGPPPALRAPPGFTCARSHARAGAVSLRLTGELDLASATFLDRAVRNAEADASQVVIDLRDLAFLDCSGMRVILGAAQRARLTGHRLTVIPGPAQVDRIFTLTGAADSIDMSADAC